VEIIVVSAPPPSAKNWNQPNYSVDDFVKGVPQMAAQARRIANEEGVLFVDAFAAFKTQADKTQTELTSDGIHPNQAGYRVMADALQQTWGFGRPLAKPDSIRMRFDTFPVRPEASRPPARE
jgi:hypothetical protein